MHVSATSCAPRVSVSLARYLRLFLGLAILPLVTTAQQTTDEDVRDYVTALQTNLLQQQNANGSWTYQAYDVGITALVLQALLRSGLAADHPAVKKAAAYISQNSDGKTYSEGLVPCALELLDHKLYRERMESAVRFLSEAQTGSGSWSYGGGRAGGGGDNSNAQFAVLGLAAARRAGIPIPAGTRDAAIAHWRKSHKSDGGWSYNGANAPTTLPMTCAGIASLEQLGLPFARRQTCCSTYEYEPEMNSGLKVLGQALQAGNLKGELYELYAVERVGIFLGLKKIGGVDWYRTGANMILRQRLGQRNISDSAFALLFLARGSAPIAIAKWEWAGDWNNQLYDMQNWTRYTGEDLNIRLDWLSAPLDDYASPAAKASLIYLTGRDVFQVTEDELDVLRAFLDADGTVVAEATCDSIDFYDSFRSTMLERLCPEYNPRFEAIQAGHPLLNAHFELTPEDLSAFRFQAGCKQYRIILLTRPIGCALNGDVASQDDLPRARRVATNLLAWSFERRKARFKLDKVTLEKLSTPGEGLTQDQIKLQSSRRGRAYSQPFGRLRHNGQWLAAPTFFRVLQASLAKMPYAVQFDTELYLSPLSEDLYQCATTFMTGYETPSFSVAEAVALRSYIQQGGFLLVTAACSSSRFDEGFRQLLPRLFPADTLQRIPADDPIWSRVYPLNGEAPQATEAYGQLYGDDWAPLYGIARDGRWRVVYSPVDFCSDMVAPLNTRVPGYRSASALPLITNILHYAFTP